MTITTSHTHKIDATGMTLGRVASEAAKALMGKMLPSYTPNKASDVKVVIDNASKLSMREKKAKQTQYVRYTGFPGGLKYETVAHLAARKGNEEVLVRAIERMLPRNKLRTPRMKNLTINA